MIGTIEMVNQLWLNLTITVSVINGSTNVIIETITVGISPVDVVVDYLTSTIYVVNSESTNVSVIGY